MNSYLADNRDELVRQLADWVGIPSVAGGLPVCRDLGGVGFFGSAAARVIVMTNDVAANLGRDFVLRGVHGLVARVLEIIDPQRHIRR